MAYENFKYEREEGVVILTLSRPERMNSISVNTIRELQQIVEGIEADPSIRALVLTGGKDAKGRPCFCAGADLKDPEIITTPNFLLIVNALLNRIEDLPIATIAAIDGACTAGGLEIALVFDVRVVSETVRIGDTHLKTVGSGLGGAGASSRLPRLIGASNAKYFAYTGDLVNGHEAVNLGFATKVFPPDKLLEGAKEIAHKAALMPAQGLKITKAHINIGMQMNTYQALHFAEQILPLAAPETMSVSAEMIDDFSKGKK